MWDLKINDDIKNNILKLINVLNYDIDDFMEDLCKSTNLMSDDKVGSLKIFIDANQEVFSDFDSNSKNILEEFVNYVNRYPSKFSIKNYEIIFQNQFMKRMQRPMLKQQKVTESRIMSQYQNNADNLSNEEYDEIIENVKSSIPPIKTRFLLKNEIFKSYKCKGEFSFISDDKIILNFDLIQFIDGNLKLNINFESKQQFIKLSKIYDQNGFECSINGDLINMRGKININKAYLTSVGTNTNFVIDEASILFDENIEYDNIRFSLLNFLNNDGFYDGFETFECEFENYKIKFEGVSQYKTYEKLLKAKELGSAVTSIATVFTNDDIKEDFEKLTFFLSYINRTPIDFICCEYYHADTLVELILSNSVSRNFSNNQKLISIDNLKDFLEEYFENFLKYYSDFSLNIVISIFLEGLGTIYSDIGYLLIEMSLETFLSQYECYCQNNGINIPNNAFKKKRSLLCEFFKDNNFYVIKEDLDILTHDLSPDFTSVGDKFTHLRKNQKFRKQLKYKEGDDYFQTIRNKIVHTGRFPDTIQNGKTQIRIGEEFERLIYLVDRIILTLLEFEGSFFKFHGSIVKL